MGAKEDEPDLWNDLAIGDLHSLLRARSPLDQIDMVGAFREKRERVNKEKLEASERERAGNAKDEEKDEKVKPLPKKGQPQHHTRRSEKLKGEKKM